MTFCEAFGHDYQLMKAYGKTYSECSHCHDITPLSDGTGFGSGYVYAGLPAPSLAEMTDATRKHLLELFGRD